MRRLPEQRIRWRVSFRSGKSKTAIRSPFLGFAPSPGGRGSGRGHQADTFPALQRFLNHPDADASPRYRRTSLRHPPPWSRFPRGCLKNHARSYCRNFPRGRWSSRRHHHLTAPPHSPGCSSVPLRLNAMQFGWSKKSVCTPWAKRCRGEDQLVELFNHRHIGRKCDTSRRSPAVSS